MTDYASLLTDFRSRRDALKRELSELDTIIGSMERLSRIAAGSTVHTAKVGGSPTAYKGMRMPQALEALYRASSEPILSTRQAIEGLTAGGVKAGKGIRGHVYSTLHRLSQDGGPFRKHDDGRWSLRERATEQEQTALFGGENAARH